MPEIFIQSEKLNIPEGFNLMEKVQEKLLTPDIRLLMSLGCMFDVGIKNNDDGSVTLAIRSREKISILKAHDGTIIDVIIKK